MTHTEQLRRALRAYDLAGPETPERIEALAAVLSAAHRVCAAPTMPNTATMARTLADRCADACDVDRDDYWKQYGQDCIEDVAAMLAAVPRSLKP